MIPGEYFLEKEDIVANQGRKTLKIKVSNQGDRPIQVGSHYHFFETNRGLLFDREKTLGMRLNVPAGTAVRFEPGQTEEVELVAIAGSGEIFGFNSLVSGSIHDDKVRKAAIKRVRAFIDGK